MLQQICHNEGAKKGTKTGPSRGPLLISRGSTFWPLFETRSFCTGVQNWPSTGWIWCLLGGPVLSPKHLLQLSCSNVETHQRNKNQHWVDNKGLEHISFRSQKRTQNKPLLLACLGDDNLSLSNTSWWKSPKPAIKALWGSARPGRSQARPGEAWARPRHGRKRIGTRTKRGSWGLETI